MMLLDTTKNNKHKVSEAVLDHPDHRQQKRTGEIRRVMHHLGVWARRGEQGGACKPAWTRHLLSENTTARAKESKRA